MAQGTQRFTAFLSFIAFSIMWLALGAAPAAAQADMAVLDVTESLEPAPLKRDFIYQLRLGNLGDKPAADAKIVVPLPKSLEFISVAPENTCHFEKATREVSCDFGELAANDRRQVDLTVRAGKKGPASIKLVAHATSAAHEIVKGNNSQNQITTFSGRTGKGVDLGIASVTELRAQKTVGERLFQIDVRNFGAKPSKAANLVIDLPRSLRLVKDKAPHGCTYNKRRHQLNCSFEGLDPVAMGGEGEQFKLRLATAPKARGMARLRARLAVRGDVNKLNNLQDLALTLGDPSQGAMAMAALADDAPKSTASIDGPSANANGATGGSEAGQDGSSAGNAGGSLFSGGISSKQNAGPNGGNVDFQISSFEPDYDLNTPGPEEVPAGAEFQLNTSLVNNGPGDANTATLDVTLPEGVAYVSGPAGCAHDGQPATGASNVHCDLGDIASGGTQDVQFTLRAVVAGRVFRTFSAVIDSSSTETNPANNSQNVNLTISNGADLLIAYDALPDPATAGGLVTYNFTITNQGLNIAEGERVVFNLPPGTTYVSAGSGGNGWSCSASGLVVTCTRTADLAATNGVVTFSVVARITGGSGNGTYSSNASVVSTTTPDVNGDNDAATHDLQVQPGTDLSVAKSVSDDPMAGGSQASFTITVTNNGPITASNLVLTDTLPANFTHVSAVGDGWTCSLNGQTVECTRPSLAVGSSDVVVTVDAPANNLIPEAGQTVINTASISSDTNDANSGNDSGQVSFFLQRNGADLAVSNYTRNPVPVAQGSAITSRFRVRNNGPLVATGPVRVSLQLDAGESYQSFSGTGWGLVGQSGNTVTFERAGNLNVGADTDYISIVSVANDAGSLTSIACTSDDAGLAPPEGDPIASNNCVSQGANSTSAIADLVMSKTATIDNAGNPLASNEDSFSYTLTVTNNGPDTAGSVRLTDWIAARVGADGSRPATTITAVPSQGSCSGASTVICQLGDIANGNNATVTITLERPMKSGDILNTASAYSQTVGDNNRANNAASVTVSIEPEVDVQLTGAAWAPNPVRAGVEAVYTLTFRNHGPSQAEGVTLQSVFGGAAYTFISATPSKGTCAAFNPGTQTLDCSIGSMADKEQQTVTVRLRPNWLAGPPNPWQITNATTVSTSSEEYNLANNAGGNDLDVIPAKIDLDVAQTDVDASEPTMIDPVGYTPTPGATDNLITYRITTTNRGPSLATGVTFVDKFTPPVGPGNPRLEFVCDKPTASGACPALAAQVCDNQGTQVNGGVQGSTTCTVKKGAADEGVLADDESYVRYLVYRLLDTPAPGGETVEKSVTVSANEDDGIEGNNEGDEPLGNNTAEEQTTVRALTDVAVSCAAPSIAGASIFEPFQYNLQVEVNGPGASNETSLNHALPTGMRLTGAPTINGGGSCSGAANGTSVNCTFNSLGNGDSRIVTVPVRFTQYPAGGNYTYNASVTTDEIDTQANNDSCNNSGTLVRSILSGHVYVDANDDGDMDAGETPLAGVQVRLTGSDIYGNAVNLTQNTSAAGAYAWGWLAPADANGYTVTETAQPASYADGQENRGGSDVIGGSHATDVIDAIALGKDDSKPDNDFGELPTDIEVVSKTPSAPTVSLLQPFDFAIVVRNNGPAAATNAALSDSLPAGLELTGAPTTDVGTCTGDTGDTAVSCDFATLASGAVVNITVPVKATTPGNKANTATASTDLTETDMANNSNTGSVNVLKASLACLVYQDLNDNGTQDNGEQGIGNTTVTLTGTDAHGNAVNTETQTAADGSCSFDNLAPSNAAGYTLTETQPANFNDGQETLSSDHGATVGADQFTAIVLAGGDNPVDPYKFGELPPTGLSGTVWCDSNNNGQIDGNEPTRIENVTITLTGTDSEGAVNRTATTDANGMYFFNDLRPSVGAGGYTLTQTQNTDHACNLPGKATAGTVDGNGVGTPDNTNASASYGNVISDIVIPQVQGGTTAIAYNFGELQTASIAGLVYNDTDKSDNRDAGEPGIEGVTITLTCTDYRERAVELTAQTIADGTYSFDNLMPSNATGCTLTETQPTGYGDGIDVAGSLGGVVAPDEINTIPVASGDAGTGYDFAEQSAGLSGHVYVDSDDDGVFDNGEPPIEGAEIRLTGTDDLGADVDRTTTTDSDGYYLFTGLRPGTYNVAETQPIAWADGKDTAGSADGTTAQDDRITAITLADTDFATDYDFGERGGSLAGTVYTDLDNDGRQDGTESGIPGAQLALTCTDVNGGAVNRATTTGDDGSYVFADLPATDNAGCTINETQPPNTTDGQDSAGSLGGTVGNDVTSGIVLTAGLHGTDYDFGEVLTNPARISGTVWHDGDHDRTDNDGSPEEGWTVELIHRDTALDCNSSVQIVATQVTNAAGDYAFEGVSPGEYDIRFRSPNGGYIYSGTQSGNNAGTDIPCGIGSITVVAGDDIINQDLPLDPSGVVYDSLTRNPVAGATVSISCANPAFDPALHIVGGAANATQTTGDDGYYQFWLLSNAPACDYQLSVDQRPAGYIPQPSAIIPACSNTLTVGANPSPALVQTSSDAPASAVTTHVADNCPTTTAALAGGASTTQYYFSFNLTPGTSAHVVNNHIPLDPVTEGAFTIAKSTPKVNVVRGELVPYTITATNNLAASLPGMELEDQLPPGFKYKSGSATLDGVRVNPLINGRQLTFPNLTFAANATRRLKMLLIVGGGVSEGEYVNKAWAENGFVQMLASNVATATVQVTPDPTFDCAGVIGKVFDDKNRNGYQDLGERGLANVRLATVRGLLVTTDTHGRYHVACADVPNQDRGSNFIMKLDPRSLPSGYRLTTENPRVIRLTRGKVGKLNFGVSTHRVVRLDITKDAFTNSCRDLRRAWRGGLRKLVSVLDKGPSVLRIAYARAPGEQVRDVRKCIGTVKDQVRRLWRHKRRKALVIETETYLTSTKSFK